MEKQTGKFCAWKKQTKEGKQVPQKLPGVLTPRKNDNSVTSDSGLCPSPTEHEYKPRFFDELEWLSSNKENMPPIESVTPPSLRNLSLEEEINEPDHKATSWEANVARNSGGFSWTKEKYPMDGKHVSEGQPPRVAFKNNDIYVVDDEESSNYEEPRERHPRVQYKL